MIKQPGHPETRNAEKNDAVSAGDMVTTTSGSRTQITLLDDSFITLAPDTSVRVNQFSFDAPKNRRTAVIRVLRGRARITVYKVRSPESDVTVQSDTAQVRLDDLGDCIVIAEPSVTEVVVLGRSPIVRNVLPYVVGEMRVNENQRIVVRDREPPIAPIAVRPEERLLLLQEFKLK